MRLINKKVFFSTVFSLYSFFQKAGFFPRGLCVFYPTCSVYAKQAFARYGFFKGSWYSLKRFFRCYPRRGFIIDFLD